MQRPPLELSSVEIREIVEGTHTRFLGDGVLEIEVASLASVAAGDGSVVDAEVHVVRPG